jgi:hypothetical protein
LNDLGVPGHASVRVVNAADPAAEAARLAEQLDADLAADIADAERLVRVRVDAGRRAVAGDAGDDGDVVARAADIRLAAAVPPPISDDDVAELRHLAGEIGRAQRIRERTEARVAEVLQARVAASTGVAIHPAAVAAAAEAVAEAEATLAAAQRALAAHGEQPPVDEDPEPASGRGADEDDPVLSRPLDDFDEAHLERRRATRRGVALAIVVVGAGFVAVGLGAPVAVLAGALAAALVAVVVSVLGGRRRATKVDAGDSHLAEVARAVASTESGRMVASLERREQWVTDRARLEGALFAAQEEARLASTRWHQLAGPSADPHDPESVIRAHDPQLAYDERVAEASPTVRTVAAFHRRTQARWRILWATLGRDDPPAPEELEGILDEVLAEHRAAQAALARLEAAEARAAAAAAARRPLVLVEPRTWVAPGRLAQLLSSVPPDGDVVLVEHG